MRTGALSSGGKAVGAWADNSSPPSAEVKDVWGYTSTLPYVFMAWYLIKHRAFIFTCSIKKELNERLLKADGVCVSRCEFHIWCQFMIHNLLTSN
jgi:hypothetical protein